MSTIDHDADQETLRAKLDILARRLNTKVREFEQRGEFSSAHETFAERFRKRHKSILEKLESAIRDGATWDIIKYGFVRDYYLLVEETEQLEETLDAETRRLERSKRSEH